MRGSARIFDVRMAQFVLKIETLSHIIGARGFQDLWSLSPIMAPALTQEPVIRSSMHGSCDFPNRVFLKHKSKMNGDFCVSKFFLRSMNGKHFMRSQSETSVFKSLLRCVDGAWYLVVRFLLVKNFWVYLPVSIKVVHAHYLDISPFNRLSTSRFEMLSPKN